MKVDDPPQVLLVDDDGDTREVLRLILESEGLEVTPAADGLDALDRLKEIRMAHPDAPCAIVLDLMMPRCSGAQFREIQLGISELRDVPVVLVSAVSDMQVHVDAMRPFAVLRKPVDVEALVGAVRSACAAHLAWPHRTE